MARKIKENRLTAPKERKISPSKDKKKEIIVVDL
jgi:hypothetical protein